MQSGGLAVWVVCLWRGLGAQPWLQTPYNDDSFNHNVTYGQNYTLTCTRGGNGQITIQYWIRPDMRLMYPGDRAVWRSLDGPAGIKVSAQGHRVDIMRLQESHFGFYYCVWRNGSAALTAVKHAINYRGPHFGNTWEKNRPRVIIGATAAGAFVLAAMIVTITAECTWRKRERRAELTEQRTHAVHFSDSCLEDTRL